MTKVIVKPGNIQKVIVKTDILNNANEAAQVAVAAKEAAEAAQTGAELAEANADKALSRIKDKKQVAEDYTLLASDEGKMILAEHATTKINIIVPDQLFTDFTSGYPVIAVRRKGLAEVEVISDGVSVVVGGANIAEQDHTISIDWENASTVTVTGGVE